MSVVDFPAAWLACQLLALCLLGLGFYALFTRRHLAAALIGVELAIAGAGVSLAASGTYAPAPGAGPVLTGQSLTLFAMGLAAAEASVVLALMAVIARRFGSVDPVRLEDALALTPAPAGPDESVSGGEDDA